MASKGAPPGSMDDMEVVDYLRSGAIVVAFVATAFAGRETWFLADLISAFAFGMAFLFFPQNILGYVTVGDLDAVHLYLGQTVGIFLLGFALTSYLSRKSNDPQVYCSIFLSRAIAGALLLQNAIFSHVQTTGQKHHFAVQAVSFGWLTQALWMISHFIQVFRTPTMTSSSVNIRSCLVTHIFLDSLVCTFATFYHFGFPEHSLSTLTMKGFKVDGIHECLVRSIGALAFSAAFHGFGALAFKHDIDKKAHMAGRLMCFAVFIPLMCLNQWKHQFVPARQMYIGLACLSVIAGNLLLGYLPKMNLKKIKQ